MKSRIQKNKVKSRRKCNGKLLQRFFVQCVRIFIKKVNHTTIVILKYIEKVQEKGSGKMLQRNLCSMCKNIWKASNAIVE